MARIFATWNGDGIFRMETALKKLRGPRRIAAVTRALNHTGNKVYTRVKRSLAKQMGLSSQKIFKDGRALKKKRASGSTLTYEIISSGRAIRMKEFRWRQTKNGITAYPWGEKFRFKSAFVIPKYGGNLYHRKTVKRFPIKSLYGPNINKEIVKDETAVAFHAVSDELAPRVEHEVRIFTDGVLS